MNKEFSGPIRLTDNSGEHLGFLLLGGAGASVEGESLNGECVFMPIPQNPEVMVGGPFRILTEHQKAGEHRFELRMENGQATLLVSGPLERRFLITVGPEGTGEWGTCKADLQMNKLGFCHATK